jgi:serine/threonine protein phosphatase PrpC
MSAVSTATHQGGRPYQEDRMVHAWIECDAGAGWLLSVFDGHRGATAAEQASQALRPLFQHHFAKHGADVVAVLDNVFRSLHSLTSKLQAGSTASVVFIPSDSQTAYVAVLGDSPVAILDASGKSHFGPDHNIRTNYLERKAALARGGVFSEGYLEDPQVPGVGLQMSRSLGDVDLTWVLERKPDIEEVPLGGEGIVLVGSDGLILPKKGHTAEQLTRLLHLIQQGADASALIQDVLKQGADDNISAIVWRAD